MAAMSKEKLVELEAQHGLKEDGLSYQLRCSRMTAVLKGETWSPPKPEQPKQGNTELSELEKMKINLKHHPLYGKKILIAPLMTLDKNRALYFEEIVGTDMEVEEVNAGAALWGAPEDIDRITADYKIISQNPNKMVTAKTSIPKGGQEISYTIGVDLVPVVRGNDNQRGYIWSMPSHIRQYGDTMIQMQGLKTLITGVAPELLEKFVGKPTMMYIDGMVIAASIPLTASILKEFRRKENQDAKLGLI